MRLARNRPAHLYSGLRQQLETFTHISRPLNLSTASRVHGCLFRHSSFGRQRVLSYIHLHLQTCLSLPQSETTTLSSNSDPRRGAATATPKRPKPSSRTSGGADPDPEEESAAGANLQIGLDPFSQQVVASALTALGAGGIATLVGLDLSTALRLEPDSLAVAIQLSAPVLILLLAVIAPRWAPPYKGTELERLRHNYYMTAQVLQLDLDLDDEDEDADSAGSSSDSGSSGWEDGPGSGGERARVRRRLRLEQTVGWGTVSSGLALMQAFTLQPWNPPTANNVFGLGLAGRTLQQLTNEFLVRGVVWGLLSGWVAGELSSADASDGILFYGKVFGGPDTVKYVAGLGLVALALPGALWEARSARNFVRASVVGPVRDAAIFCTGNGVDEPAYCDPAGFAMMAARWPANAASVADVVTRTRSWRSGPNAPYSSVSSLSSVDLADMEVDDGALQQQQQQPLEEMQMEKDKASANGQAPAAAAAAAAVAASGGSSPAATSHSPASPVPAVNGVPTASSGATRGSAELPAVGATVQPTSAAFEWDNEDMGVLLRVETLQDKIAFWSSLYYQMLAAFAINGAFLASDCNLAASFGAAWLLRTGPLLLAELRARSTADAAMR